MERAGDKGDVQLSCPHHICMLVFMHEQQQCTEVHLFRPRPKKCTVLEHGTECSHKSNIQDYVYTGLLLCLCP